MGWDRGIFHGSSIPSGVIKRGWLGHPQKNLGEDDGKIIEHS